MKRLFKAIGTYFRDSFDELKKVTWPTRNKSIRLTFIVLSFCLVSALILGVLDLGFHRGYQLLVNYALQVAPPSDNQLTTPLTEELPVTPEAEVDVNASGPVQVETVPTEPTPSN